MRREREMNNMKYRVKVKVNVEERKRVRVVRVKNHSMEYYIITFACNLSRTYYIPHSAVLYRKESINKASKKCQSLKICHKTVEAE